MERNIRIDQLRGLLIALVIVGHIVLGSVHDNLIRYSIYAFHMPLFIALSGYLISTRSLVSQSFSQIWQRYWQRAVKPFLLAFILFTGILAFHAYQENRMDPAWFLSALLSPYYHLWFVPTLVLWVVALAIVLKVRIPLWFALLVSVAASLLWASIESDQQLKLIGLLLSKKLVYFFSFFLLGVKLREWQESRSLSRLNRYSVLLLGLALLAALIYLQAIGVHKTPLKAVAWYLLNSALFLFCLTWIYPGAVGASVAVKTPSQQKRLRAMEWVGETLAMMGRLSLPIYLWHVLPLFFLKGFDVHESHQALYYILSSASCIAVVWLVKSGEHRSGLLDRWFYGIPSK